jgi:hypothetical protein
MLSVRILYPSAYLVHSYCTQHCTRVRMSVFTMRRTYVYAHMSRFTDVKD